MDGIPAASWWFLATSLVGLWFTAQAVRPVPLPRLLGIPSFFAGWLANELVVHHVVWQSAAVGLWVWWDALDAWPGWVALGVTGLQWVLALGLLRLALRAPGIVEDALVEALGEGYRDELPEVGPGWDRPRWLPILVPAVTGHRDVAYRGRVPYARVAGRELVLDVFTPRTPAPAGGRPAIVYVHGGGWVLGYRDRQGDPLLVEMARRGWVGIRPEYRLSPTATYPDHLVDVKRAIAWVREHAAELGVDPDFIAVSGGSAGGHLAAMATLTPDRQDLQPGFEDADTRVQASVPIYGVYDVTEEHMKEFLTPYVLKAHEDEDPRRWSDFRPIEHLRADAPPLLAVHGARDSLTSPQDARRFTSNLREISTSPVGLVELPGAQHAFDIFPSLRSGHAVLGMARFLGVARARQLAGSQVRTVGTADRGEAAG